MNNIKILQTTLIITIVLILSKLSGFLRDVALAYAYGTSFYSDAFVLTQSVVSIFSLLLFTSLGVAFIPIFSKLKLSENDSELKAFVDNTFSVVGLIVVIICIIGIASADIIVYYLAPGFSDETHELAVKLTRLIFPSVFLSFLATVQGQLQRGNNIFMPSSCLAFPLNFSLIIALVFLAPNIGIESAVYAFVIGTFIQALMLCPFTRKLGYHFHFHLNLKNSGLREILLLTLPILLGNTIQTIDSIINKILASGLAEGSMAALNFSNKLSLFIIGLISLGAGTVCYTKMSELGARKEHDELKKFLRSIINILVVIVVPASIGMMALNFPIIRFVFEYGAFDSSSSEITAAALWYYSIGLIGFVLRDIITRAFYALGDANTPMINGGIAVGIGIILNLILVRYMGIGGLALATSISGIFGTLLLLISLRKKLGQIGYKELGATFIKTCVSGAAMGAAVHFLYPILYQGIGIPAVALVVDILCGISVYSILILFMRIREVDFAVRYLNRRLTRAKPEASEQ